MTTRFQRRAFLAGLCAAPWLVRCAAAETDAHAAAAEPKLDIHIHLFGVGDTDSGCILSERIRKAPVFSILAGMLGIQQNGKTLDAGYVLTLAEQFRLSGLTKGLILAQDAVYDRNGKPDWTNTHFYVPNDYLFRVVKRYPQWMIPCVSINPDRGDCLEELARCKEQGARILKIHPPIQGVDLVARKHTKFFQRCAALKIKVMVHTGHEHSAPIVNAGLANPRKLELALNQGCDVVACHCGSGLPSDRPDMLNDFFAMVKRHKNLWGDTSVLGSVGRTADFLRLLDNDRVHDRLLHGSDFPFPSVPLAFKQRLGLAETMRLQMVPTMLGRDLALKEALGIGNASAQRAYDFVLGEKEPS